ncbi:hypothetical protein ACHAP5_006264 [Fusarium lateritium]
MTGAEDYFSWDADLIDFAPSLRNGEDEPLQYNGLYNGLPGLGSVMDDVNPAGINMRNDPVSSNGQAVNDPEPDATAANGPTVPATTSDFEDWIASGMSLDDEAEADAEAENEEEEEGEEDFGQLEFSWIIPGPQIPAQFPSGDLIRTPSFENPPEFQPFDTQASGRVQPDIPAANWSPNSQPLLYRCFGNGDMLLQTGQQGADFGIHGPQAPVQAPGNAFPQPLPFRQAPRGQSSGIGPQISGRGNPQPGHRVAKTFRGAFSNSHFGRRARNLQSMGVQSSAPQPPVPQSVWSYANNGNGNQPQSLQNVIAQFTPSQNILSSDVQHYTWEARKDFGAHYSTFAYPSASGSAHGQGLSGNNPQNPNHMEPTPMMPRPPQNGRRQVEGRDKRYCVECANQVATLELRCRKCQQRPSAGIPQYRHCRFCQELTTAPNTIVCPSHERKIGTGVTKSEKEALANEGMCKRCYKAESTKTSKCDKCSGDQKRYSATSRESRLENGTCLNCRRKVEDPQFKNCEACRKQKAEMSKQTRRQNRDKQL